MFELLFLLVFVLSFAVFGLSLLSVVVVIGVSLAFMLLMGMVSFIVKMLPWLLVIALVVLWVRHQRVR